MISDLFYYFIEPFWTTLLFFTLSAALSLIMAVFLCLGQISRFKIIRWTVVGLIELSRGVPTVVFVILLGNFGMAPYFSAFDTDTALPGVAWGFNVVAYFVILGLAFSSAGHLTYIFRAAISTISDDVWRYLNITKSRWHRAVSMIYIECAPALLPAVTARLVHHLHNTAFIAMFPITGIFGAMRSGIVETALVVEYILFSTLIYIFIGATLTVISKVILYLHPRPSTVDLAGN